MDYIQQNKLAWEEAFDKRRSDWGRDYDQRLNNETLPFFCDDVKTVLQTMDLKGKSIAQFCCNDGRELLSLARYGAGQCVGFDIAENMLAQAAQTAEAAGIQNCSFVQGNILDIDVRYHNTFDVIYFTIGAITWFQDLRPLLQKVSDCLKVGGVLLIHDSHPFMNMLPLPGEPAFDAQDLQRITYSYFRTEPWLENQGMGYLAGTYDSQTFTSFSHTLSETINAACAAKLCITQMQEFDYAVDGSTEYDHRGMPLSYLLIARKL